MYIPTTFAMHAADARALIAAHPFAWLEVGDDVAAIPLVAREGEPLMLDGHVAAASPIAGSIRIGGRARVLFTGPHAYVSPRWYRSAGQVPTWSYAAVVASGAIRAADLDATIAILDALTRRFEPEDGWSVHSLEPRMLAGLARGVVAFTIEVERLESKAKLSQNRAREDRVGAIEGLRAAGESPTADLTERVLRGERVFPG